jgi:cytochrome c
MKRVRLMLVTGMLAAGVAHAQSQDGPALLEKYGCSSCHADNEAITGPAFVDVAAQYRGNPHATALLVALVRKGAHGGGPWPMPPSPQVPTTDAAKMVHYILTLKK